jgi:hypothetical protein
MGLNFPRWDGLPPFACTYVHRLDAPFLSGRFGFLDHLLLGSRRTDISRLEDIIGQVETGSRLNHVQNSIRQRLTCEHALPTSR